MRGKADSCSKTESEFVNSFKEPRNRFIAWWAGTTTLFDVPYTGPPDYIG
jgi:hypothetical protein